MKSIYDFIIEPKNTRYNNTKKVGDKELVLNTEIFNHQYVSREAVIKHLPLAIQTELQVGDEVIIHHNVFRRWHNMQGKEKNSRSYIDENTYCVKEDQIYSYNRNNQGWKTLNGYCFVKPIKSNDNFTTKKEEVLVGIMKYMDPLLKEYNISEGDLVGFTPDSEYEFVINGEKLYRILTTDISLKYEYKGNEEEYNPSWTSSS
tara:strand:+ start:518 stop:1126 length:609 start_codon:yes stop_codon:yes gene_type:complete